MCWTAVGFQPLHRGRSAQETRRSSSFTTYGANDMVLDNWAWWTVPPDMAATILTGCGSERFSQCDPAKAPTSNCFPRAVVTESSSTSKGVERAHVAEQLMLASKATSN
jgi:hypothetical protein